MGEASVFAQPGSGVRFDWGASAAAELARACAVLVVVDVLSFTTAVDVAVGRGMRVHPFPWGGQARGYARRIGAQVAVGRSATTPDHPWSLSPAALARAPVVADLVLPSPNGSAICAAAASTGVPVVSACLRNAAAAARWLLQQGYGTRTAAVGVIAAGERWPDGALRPAVEDLLGSAAVLNGLSGVPGGLSVEAAMALAALPTTPVTAVPDGAAADVTAATMTASIVAAAVRGCVSGQELIDRGYAADVEIAVQAGASEVVPVLRDGAFTAASPQ